VFVAVDEHRIAKPDAHPALKHGKPEAVRRTADMHDSGADLGRIGPTPFREIIDREVRDENAEAFKPRPVVQIKMKADASLFIEARNRHIVEMVVEVHVAEARHHIDPKRIGSQIPAARIIPHACIIPRP
tara:strand:- start:16595 stop:16984 length:390 start_codon:yes stop_codon:yes gene_type:complete